MAALAGLTAIQGPILAKHMPQTTEPESLGECTKARVLIAMPPNRGKLSFQRALGGLATISVSRDLSGSRIVDISGEVTVY